MRSIALSILSFICVTLADQNITIDDTDTSIQYTGYVERSSPCNVDADGNILPGQPGCFNNGLVNCSSGAHLLDGTLSMQFKGSAIYMNALLSDLTNIYTITLDGKSTDVDGARPGGALLCYTLFSQTGLDPTTEHNISLTIKGLSPTRNTTGNDDLFFWLDNFIVTTPDENSSSHSSADSGTSGTPTTPSPSSSPTTGTSGVLSRLAGTSPWIYFGVAAGSFLLVL